MWFLNVVTLNCLNLYIRGFMFFFLLNLKKVVFKNLKSLINELISRGLKCKGTYFTKKIRMCLETKNSDVQYLMQMVLRSCKCTKL